MDGVTLAFTGATTTIVIFTTGTNFDVALCGEFAVLTQIPMFESAVAIRFTDWEIAGCDDSSPSTDEVNP